jgi:crotonobetainyl-CoA:carnitine CoA-transferase CaiB-like acyl-CoA transferase
MSLGALELKFWQNFCEAVGRRDLIDKQFIEGEERLRVIKEIQNLFKTKTQEAWVDFFKSVDACCEPVLTFEEVFQHPQVLHRQMVTEVEHPIEGKIRQLGNPIKSSQFPFEIRTPAPAWGEHTIGVLKAVGFSGKEIKHFKGVKAI